MQVKIAEQILFLGQYLLFSCYSDFSHFCFDFQFCHLAFSWLFRCLAKNNIRKYFAPACNIARNIFQMICLLMYLHLSVRNILLRKPICCPRHWRSANGSKRRRQMGGWVVERGLNRNWTTHCNCICFCYFLRVLHRHTANVNTNK